MPTNSAISVARPPSFAGTMMPAVVAACACAGLLIVSDGQPLKVGLIAWAFLLAAACLPVTLYFRGLTERLLLFGLVLTLPVSLKVHLLFREGHMGGAIGLRVSITEILMGCVLVACIWRMMNSAARTRIAVDPTIRKALAVYLACAAISTLLGSDGELGLYQLAAIVQAFLVFVFVTNYVTSAQRLRICIVGAVLSLAVQSAIAIVQVEKPGLVNLSSLGAEEQSEETVVAGSVALPNVDKGTTTIAGEIEHRPSGLLIHPNVLAAYLVLSIPLAFAGWVVASSFWMQSLCLLSAGAGLAALYFSLSRSGWAGLGLALLLMAWLWRRLPLQKATAAKKLVIAVAVVGALVGIAWQSQKIYLRLTESASDAVNFRSELAATAWNMTKAHPFFGVGYNSFTENMDDYDEGGMSRIKKFPAHNVYLLELGEGGILTGAAFVVLVGALLVRLFKVSTGSQDPVLGTIAVFTACGVCGFWLTQVSDYVYRIPILTTLVWFHAGLVFATANLRERPTA